MYMYKVPPPTTTTTHRENYLFEEIPSKPKEIEGIRHQREMLSRGVCATNMYMRDRERDYTIVKALAPLLRHYDFSLES